MTVKYGYEIDPRLDLVLEREVDVPPELVWDAWTKPEHIVHWFTPAPWTTVNAEMDLRPGGKFFFTMRSPEGKEFPNSGCYLEVIEKKKIVFTDTLHAGYRPSQNPFFTAIVLLEPTAKGTKYVAIARHKDETDMKKHEQMGFHDGWGKALDQLVAYMRKR